MHKFNFGTCVPKLTFTYGSMKKVKPRAYYNKENLNTPMENLEACIDNIVLQHKVHLKKLREKLLTAIPFASTIIAIEEALIDQGNGSSIERSL